MSDSGHGVRNLDCNELFEIHDWVEGGPHWGTIKKIEIIYNHGDGKLTVEDAEKL